jgi:hypothetical protein
MNRGANNHVNEENRPTDRVRWFCARMLALAWALSLSRQLRCELRKPWPFPTGAMELFSAVANATFRSLFP